ncbi:MAG: hypothetical protein K2X03_09915 [Bryobacteraceae bacterium]|nr:hypothetical protein [Bryobacteraceae bacterium]
MLAHESQFNRFAGGKNYWNSFTFGTVGLSKDTEFAATLYGLGRPASGNVSLGIGLKHRVLNKQTASGWHWEATSGFMVPFSLSGRGTGLWGYGNVSLRTPKSKTRLTAGPSYGSSQIFGRRAYSTMVGVEQPLSKHFTLVADYFSGTHELAAAIGGFAWHPRRELVVIFAYKVPNNAISGKPAPLVELTYTFGARKH